MRSHGIRQGRVCLGRKAAFAAALFLGGLALAAPAANAAPAAPESAKPVRDHWLSAEMKAGFKQSLWSPGMRQDVMTFDTEGLSSYDASLLLRFRAKPFFYYHQEGPLRNTPSQKELFALNEEDTSALKKYNLGILFRWIDLLHKGESLVLRVLANTEYAHTEETYFGHANVVTPFTYIPNDTVTEPLPNGNIRFYGVRTFRPGESVEFRTRFEDDEITVAWPVTFRTWTFQVRGGYYSTTWLRPSDLDREWRLVKDNTLMIYETEFASRGVVLGLEPADREQPGLNGRITGRWGFDNDIRNLVDRDFQIEAGTELLYAAGVIEAWYNWALGRAPGRRFSLSLGGLLDHRIFATEIHPLRGTWETDNLYRVYAALNTRF